MDFTKQGLTVYMMIVAIVMTSKTIETMFHEASAGGIFYVQTLYLWQAYTGIPFDWRAMRVAGPHTSTFLVIMPAFIMSVVMEADPDNIARGLYLLGCGGLTGAYVLTWHRRINGSQITFNQAAVLVFGVLSTSSSSWHLEDNLRRSMLRIVLAGIPPLVSYCQGDVLITPSHGANLVLNVCLIVFDTLTVTTGLTQRLEWLQPTAREGSKTLLKREGLSKDTSIMLWVAGLSIGIVLALATWYFPNPPRATLRRLFRRGQPAAQNDNGTPQNDARELNTFGTNSTGGQSVEASVSTTQGVIAGRSSNAGDEPGKGSGGCTSRPLPSSGAPMETGINHHDNVQAGMSVEGQGGAMADPQGSIPMANASDAVHDGEA